MTKESLVTELTSTIEFIEKTRNRVSMDYDKFQVALSNTLRLLSDGSSTLVKMKGSADDLKGYLVKTTSEIRQTTLQPFDKLKSRMEKILELVQTI